ncbi:hypothetical protein Niako_2395 [Niastella koreensis GR20-10]|uniref:Transmembrane protein n=1 Tax=Niastella koreensis (strain DSM 17620 / KACC 11465 / NBRC 106392 / GR20-10) TaxID=700598 RepID=G8TLX9_NIAKG|nr:hypothetical protein [Niastella koreensis]AEV98739.1 hypothetical protein Niako_2395 [Niastella koreensis GR20-10]
MKKTRIILTSLAIVAVVGSALAFKASKKDSVIFCSTSASTGANCAIQVNKTYTIDLDNGTSFCTTDGSLTRSCSDKSDISFLQ